MGVFKASGLSFLSPRRSPGVIPFDRTHHEAGREGGAAFRQAD